MMICGIVVMLLLYISVFYAFATGKRQCLISAYWWLILAGICFAPEKKDSPNALLAVIAVYMLGVLFFSFWRLKMWCIRRKSKVSGFSIVSYFITTMLIFYSYTQACEFGIFPPFWQMGGKLLLVMQLLQSVGLALFSFKVNRISMMLVERYFSKPAYLVLIQCRCLRPRDILFGEPPCMTGIHNGIIYRFQMDRGTFFKSRRESIFELNVRKGCFGGLFVYEEPFSCTKKKWREYIRPLKLRFLCFLPIFAAVSVLWLYLLGVFS
ncbi:MAG: hypothetical protein KHZ62_04745 [Clostridiales bacterium]|nr:hypothetical protein [Clostridiales bacterium]